MVAHADNGKWLYLFRPELISDKSEGNIDTKNLIQTGVFRSERLVNMSRHDYALEPNAMFSPDMKVAHLPLQYERQKPGYAVELKKAERGGLPAVDSPIRDRPPA
jgi:oligogalacturonide lyase